LLQSRSSNVQEVIGDEMPTLFKEVQDEDGLDKAHAEESPKEVGSSPDIVLEHGSTRLSLDLDGWEWFWLFLAICFIGSLSLFIQSNIN